MTALAGYWGFADGARAERHCVRMLAAQSLYGQESAHAVDGAIALGRRIFRTLPEDRFDRRPLTGAHGRILVADVRLDDRDELARALRLDAGAMADAQLLLHALERWGDDAVARLTGEFAFACWEPERQRLVLARDFAGQRPLFYHRAPGFFAFASMPKGLLALPEIPRRPNMEALAAWLAAITKRSHSFFEGVATVQPGEMLIVTRAEMTARLHWQPDLSPLILDDESEYAATLIALLDQAVAARLRGAGAAVGSHLSAGLDSAAVATAAARLMAQQEGTVTAFTAAPRAGYDGPVPAGRLADESDTAAATASLYANVEHVLVRSSGEDPLGRLDRSFALADQPAMSPSNSAWIDGIKDEARRRGLKVLLIGEFGNLSLSYGGDELLSQLLARGRLLRLAREVKGMRRAGKRWRTIAALAAGPLLPVGWWNLARRLRGLAVDVAGSSALRPEVRRRLARADRASLTIARRSRDHLGPWLEAIRRYDPGTSRKATLAGWGLDVRDPTADRRLVEFCLRVPLEIFHRDGQPSALARQALSNRLAPAALAERRRGYQAADWHEAAVQAKGQLAEAVESAARSPDTAEILDVEELARLVAEMPETGWETPAIIAGYRSGLLRAIAAADFIRRANGANN